MQSLLCAVVVVTSTNINTPKVYEIVDETRPNRHPRQPEAAPKTHLYSPPKFEYHTTVQQDPQILRYYKQQQVNLHSRKERIAPVTPHPLAAALLGNTRRNIHVVPVTVPKPENLLRVARKLSSNNYHVNDEELQPTVASPPAIYIQSEQNLKALNELIGKNPNVQLQGLKQLLENHSQVKLLMPPIEHGPSPFQTNPQNAPPNPHAEDINAAAETAAENDDESKEIIYNPNQQSISEIQAKLDESARIQAQNAIAAAQQQALEHVKQQHKALAEAQAEARRIALEKVRAHNEAISQVYVRKKEDADEDEVAASAQTAENRIHTQHQVITILEEPQQHQQQQEQLEDVGLIQAHNEALLQAQHEQQEEYEQSHHHHQVIPTQIVYQQLEHSNQDEELQKLAEESNKAYGGEHEDVSKSKCKKFVNEKLEMFRQQFCNHLKFSGKSAVKNESLKDFVLELNCVKMERAKNFFSTKLQEMYRENRKAFFSLCYFNVSKIQLINEFVFSNNLTDFNENLLRQKREIESDYEGGEDDYSYVVVSDDTKNETDADTLPLASAQKLVAGSKFHKHKLTHHPTPVYELAHKDEHKEKEPANVIVINNSNDNHNYGANVKFEHQIPPVMHRPFKHRPKKPKRTHTHKIIIHKKPSVKRILRVSKKVDTVLSKLGHTIIRVR